MQVKYLAFLGFVIIFALAASVGLGLFVGQKILGEAKEESAVPVGNTYVTIIEYDRPLPEFRVQSTFGEITVPVKGKVNIVLPQYVYCPDVCHWETSILLYALEMLKEKGYMDDIVIVTIGVNPFYETLDQGREYQLSKLGDYIEEGLEWYWVLEPYEIQKQLWDAFGIGVVPYCIIEEGGEETYVELTPEEFIQWIEEGKVDPVLECGVNHTAGFFLVDREGNLRYFVSPTQDGWVKGQKYVAEALVEYVVKLIEEG